MSSISPRPSLISTSILTTATMSSVRSTRSVSSRLEAEAHVHLDPADRRQVVALGVEEQAVEQRLGGVQRRRLARAQHPVDVEQRLLAVLAAVERERVADVGADREVVDVEDRDLLDPGLGQLARSPRRSARRRPRRRTRPVSSSIRSRRDDSGRPAPRRRCRPRSTPCSSSCLTRRGVILVPASASVSPVAASTRSAVSFWPRRRSGRNAVRQPCPARWNEDLVVEGVEDRLLVEPEGQQQRRHRQLAAPVDADVDEVLGVELEVEPGAAVGDDPGRVEELARAVGLAAVVVEEHAGLAVHLARR